MRKQFLIAGFGLAAFLAAALSLAQTPTPTETPQPTPMLVSTSTPTPMPSVTPTITPSGAGTVSVPTSLGGPSPIIEAPSPPPTLDVASLGWSEKGSPKFMVEQAVVLALQQNPDVRRALEEIKRTKGVIIQIRTEALPQIRPSFHWGWTDPNLRENSSFSTFGSHPTPPPGGTPFPGVGGIKNLRSDIAYN